MQTRNRQSIDIDIRKPSIIGIPQFIQQDTNVLEINIKENGEYADLSLIGNIVVNFKRPDKHIVSRLLEANGSEVSYQLGQEEMEKPGVCLVELQFFNSNNLERISSLKFKLILIDSIGSTTLQQKADDVTLLQELFIETEEKGSYALEQGDYAKQEGDKAKLESDNLSTLKNDVQAATIAANEAKEEADAAASEASAQAIFAQTQGDHAKTQGDYAKQEADRLVGTDVSILDNKITDVTLQLAEKASQVDLTNSLVPKADKSYVDTQISNIGTASPKGTYATVSGLQTAFPTGTTGIYVVTADGKWYYWNGSAWTAGGTYQSTSVADKSITPEKISFLKKGKNILSEDGWLANTSVSRTTGTTVTSTNWTTCDFIPVLPNTEYMPRFLSRGCYYDSNKVYISGFGPDNAGSAEAGVPFVTPSNASFVRISWKTTASKMQLELGNVFTGYEPPLIVTSQKTIAYNRSEMRPVNTELQYDGTGRLSKVLEKIDGVLIRETSLSYSNGAVSVITSDDKETLVKQQKTLMFAGNVLTSVTTAII